MILKIYKAMSVLTHTNLYDIELSQEWYELEWSDLHSSQQLMSLFEFHCPLSSGGHPSPSHNRSRPWSWSCPMAYNVTRPDTYHIHTLSERDRLVCLFFFLPVSILLFIVYLQVAIDIGWTAVTMHLEFPPDYLYIIVDWLNVRRGLVFHPRGEWEYDIIWTGLLVPTIW